MLNDKISPKEFNEKRYRETYYNMSYGRYWFNEPELDEEAVYIVKDNQYLMQNLEKLNFTIEYLNNYAIAYK